jgi:hypothetical protein
MSGCYNYLLRWPHVTSYNVVCAGLVCEISAYSILKIENEQSELDILMCCSW